MSVLTAGLSHFVRPSCQVKPFALDRACNPFKHINNNNDDDDDDNGDDDDDNNNNNYNNNNDDSNNNHHHRHHIQRRNSRFFTISSLRHERSSGPGAIVCK